MFIFAACRESDGNFKVNPSGRIDLNLFFCRARTHYKVSEIPRFVFCSRVAHLKRCFGPDLDIRNFKRRILKPADPDRDVTLSPSAPVNSPPSDTGLLFLQHDCSLI